MIAGLLVAAGRVWRPIFWRALAGLVVCLVLAWPDIAPLVTAAAYPTIFDVSPAGFTARSITRGGALFRTDCAGCHGADARGNGPLAKSLPVSPGDLTAAHFRAPSDGDLLWFISRGIASSPGLPAMPACGNRFSPGRIGSLIDVLKANNAGAGVRTSGRWNHPIARPWFDAVCADGAAI